MTARRVAALVLATVVAGIACSGPPATDAGDRTRLGEDAGTAKGDGRKRVPKKAKKVAEDAQRGGRNRVPGAAGRAIGKPPKSSDGTGGGSSEIDPSLARRSARITDPNDDARKEGVTPSYAEIIAASIEGLGTDFRMTLTLDGQVPQTMPNDKTHFIVAFGITGESQNEGYSFGAQCTQKGWNAFAGGRDDSGGRFPGTFVVNGNKIEMTVPWEYIRGPRRFEWYAASNWFSQLANTTHYRVDLAPSEGMAKFPN